jgi:hypothetical protein
VTTYWIRFEAAAVQERNLQDSVKENRKKENEDNRIVLRLISAVQTVSA